MRRGWLVAACLLACGGPATVARPVPRPSLVVVVPPKPVPPPAAPEERSALGEPVEIGPLGKLAEPPNERRIEGARWVSPSAGVYLEGKVALVAPLGDETALFRVVNPHGKAWACASIAPNRRLLVVYDGEKVGLWRHGESAPLLSTPLPLLSKGQFVHGGRCAVSWAPSSEALLIGGQLWHTTTGRVVSLDTDCHHCAHFSPTGRYLHYISGGKLKVRTFADHQLVMELPSPGGGLFDNQDRLLAAHNEVWDMAAQRRVLTTDKQVRSFSPDGRFAMLVTPLPVHEKHIVELATGRTRALVRLGPSRWGSREVWSADSRYFATCDFREIHVVDLQNGEHKTIPSNESCPDTLAGPVAARSFATSSRLLRFSPLAAEGLFSPGGAGELPPLVSPDGRFLVSPLRLLGDFVAPGHGVVYRAAPFENLWPILRGTFDWLPDAPLLGRIPPQADYWELLSPVERVRVRVRVLRSKAAGATCLAAAREGDEVDVLCPAGVDPPEEARGFDGGPARGREPHLLRSLLETARRGFLKAPLASPPPP